MRCKNAREILNQHSDGESLMGWTERLILWRHCLGCPGCRAAGRQYRHLRQLTRSLPRPLPSPSLRGSVLAALPPVSLKPSTRRQKEQTMRNIRIATVATTLILAIALMMWPRSQPPVSAAARVRQSLDQVNTWRLVGWKLLDGKRVDWEVWGQRKPFFYRERIGDETVLDDGIQRVRVLDSAPTLNRPRGIVLRTPSQPSLNIVGYGFIHSFKDTLGTRPIQQETADEIVFGAQNNMDARQRHDIYTISKRTWLPVRYEVREGVDSAIVEHLDAVYDVPLLEPLRHLAWPANYLVIDGGSASDTTELPRDNVARYGGLTVQLTPLAMDSRGRILARVRAWLGSVRIAGGPFYMHVIPEHPEIAPEAALHSISDDQGRPYLFVPMEGFRLLPDMNPGTDRLVYFAPFKPLPPNTLPRQLRVKLHVAPFTSIKMSGGGNDGSVQQCILMSTDLTWNVTLPTRPSPLNPDAYLFKGWRERVKTTNNVIPPLDVSVAEARAQMQQQLSNPTKL